MSPFCARPTPPDKPYHSSGFFLLVVLLSLLGILGVALFTALASGSYRIQRSTSNAIALAKAKEALLAYVITRDDDGRPGEFPCPTTVAPGAATYGTSAVGCASVRIGRLPWKTLGIPEILDGDGEPLWYVVSNKFRPLVTMINSDITGDMPAYAADGATVLGNQIVAVLFTAGSPVGNQTRSAAVLPCSATGTNIAANLCAENYLDTAFGRNNAANAGPFISGDASSTFNDQLTLITTADFIPKIEDRIAKLLTRSLNNYYALHGYYPYAANYTDYTSPNKLNCANGKYVGRLPKFIAAAPLTGAQCTTLADWQSVGDPNGLPAWFSDNNWNSAIHYVVGKAYAEGGSKTCALPGDCLTAGASTAVQALFILPGIATASQTRPSGTPANYLEVPEDLDDWPVPLNYSYLNSTTALPSRDRIYPIKNP